MAEERVQRRLAAILAADVVGYSRLMERDETGTLARLKSLRAEVFDPTTKRFDGRIFKNTGDGALAEFASAVVAVQCAVEIQRALAERNAELPEDARVVLRIGISLGDVIVDGDDLFGNGVNIAARMESLAEPGAICVSANVHEHIGNTLDVTFEDLGEQAVKNIDRPVRSYRVHLGPAAPVSDTAEPLPLPDKPSIAVLPFQNMSGDAEQEFLADGVAEDIITALSRLRWLFVIARNSSFAYKGAAPDVREVARDLGVRYVLEGSVRRAGNRVRVTGQLIDATTSNHIWAERYDRDIEGIFELQDEITMAIVRAVDPEIQGAEQERALRKHPENLTAWDHYQRGLWHQYQMTRENQDQAREHLSAAISADPGFARAWAVKSFIVYQDVVLSWTDSPDDTLAEAQKLAEKAISLDGKEPFAHFALGRVFFIRGDFSRAISQLELALELNPNFALACFAVGHALLSSGRVEDSLRHFDEAIRQSPRDPWLYLYQQIKAIALAHLDRYDEALDCCAKAIRHQSADYSSQVIYASVLGQMGRIDEARRQLAAATAKEPAKIVPAPLRAMFEEGREKFIDGLRKAGLPEESPEIQTPNSEPDKPSIAVLPFDNMSGDAEQEYFADGLAEDVITALSKISKLAVIARNSTFVYKGTATDVRRIAEDLGVCYVLEGSVRSGGTRLRVSAQLIDATDGRHVWAERYDRVAEDLFDLQDEITKEIVTALRVQLSDGEEALVWNRGTKNVEAWRCATEATELFLRFTPADIARARELSQRAIDLDPDYAHAWSVNAICDLYMARIGPGDDVETLVDRAEQSLLKARSIDDTVSWVHFGMSFLLAHRREFDAAVDAARNAVALQPGNSEIRGGLGYAQIRAGHTEAALQTMQDALRLNPYAHGWYRLLIARAFDMLGDAEKALHESQDIASDIPFGAYLNIACLQARMGRPAEAKTALAEALRLNPQFTLSAVERYLNCRDGDYVETVKDGLRKAGLPE